MATLNITLESSDFSKSLDDLLVKTDKTANSIKSKFKKISEETGKELEKIQSKDIKINISVDAEKIDKKVSKIFADFEKQIKKSSNLSKQLSEAVFGKSSINETSKYIQENLEKTRSNIIKQIDKMYEDVKKHINSKAKIKLDFIDTNIQDIASTEIKKAIKKKPAKTKAVTVQEVSTDQSDIEESITPPAKKVVKKTTKEKVKEINNNIEKVQANEKEIYKEMLTLYAEYRKMIKKVSDDGSKSLSDISSFTDSNNIKTTIGDYKNKIRQQIEVFVKQINDMGKALNLTDLEKIMYEKLHGKESFFGGSQASHTISNIEEKTSLAKSINKSLIEKELAKLGEGAKLESKPAGYVEKIYHDDYASRSRHEEVNAILKTMSAEYTRYVNKTLGQYRDSPDVLKKKRSAILGSAHGTKEKDAMHASISDSAHELSTKFADIIGNVTSSELEKHLYTVFQKQDLFKDNKNAKDNIDWEVLSLTNKYKKEFENIKSIDIKQPSFTKIEDAISSKKPDPKTPEKSLEVPDDIKRYIAKIKSTLERLDKIANKYNTNNSTDHIKQTLSNINASSQDVISVSAIIDDIESNKTIAKDTDIEKLKAEQEKIKTSIKNISSSLKEARKSIIKPADIVTPAIDLTPEIEHVQPSADPKVELLKQLKNKMEERLKLSIEQQNILTRNKVSKAKDLKDKDAELYQKEFGDFFIKASQNQAEALSILKEYNKDIPKAESKLTLDKLNAIYRSLYNPQGGLSAFQSNEKYKGKKLSDLNRPDIFSNELLHNLSSAMPAVAEKFEISTTKKIMNEVTKILGGEGGAATIGAASLGSLDLMAAGLEKIKNIYNAIKEKVKAYNDSLRQASQQTEILIGQTQYIKASRYLDQTDQSKFSELNEVMRVQTANVKNAYMNQTFPADRFNNEFKPMHKDLKEFMKTAKEFERFKIKPFEDTSTDYDNRYKELLNFEKKLHDIIKRTEDNSLFEGVYGSNTKRVEFQGKFNAMFDQIKSDVAREKKSLERALGTGDLENEFYNLSFKRMSWIATNAEKERHTFLKGSLDPKIVDSVKKSINEDQSIINTINENREIERLKQIKILLEQINELKAIQKKFDRAGASTSYQQIGNDISRMENLVTQLGPKGAKRNDQATFDKIVESTEKSINIKKKWAAEEDRIITNTLKKQAERQGMMSKFMESWGITMSGVAATVFVGQYMATTFNTLLKFKTDIEDKIEALGVKSTKGDRQTLGTSQQEGIEKIIRGVAANSSVTTDQALAYMKNKMTEGYDMNSALKNLVDKRMKYEMDTFSNSITALTNIIKEVVMSVFDEFSESSKNYVDDLTKFIRTNKTEIVNITKSFVDFGITVVTAFKPVLSFFGTMITMLKEIVNFMPGLSKGVVLFAGSLMLLNKLPIFGALAASLQRDVTSHVLNSGITIGQTVTQSIRDKVTPMLAGTMITLGRFAGSLLIKSLLAGATFGLSFLAITGIEWILSKVSDKYGAPETDVEKYNRTLKSKKDELKEIESKISQIESKKSSDPYSSNKNSQTLATYRISQQKLKSEIDSINQNSRVDQKAIVYSVIDGDTVSVMIDDEFTKVRLAYINTQESVHKDISRNNLKGIMTSQMVKNMLGAGDEVNLSGPRDAEGKLKRDLYNRVIAELRKNDTYIQEILIKSGMAKYEEYTDKATGQKSVNNFLKALTPDPQMVKNAETITNRMINVAKILNIDLSPEKLSLGNTQAFISEYTNQILQLNDITNKINELNAKTPDHVKTATMIFPESSGDIEKYKKDLAELEKIKKRQSALSEEKQAIQSLIMDTKEFKYNTYSQEAMAIFDQAFSKSKSLQKDKDGGSDAFNNLRTSFIKAYAELSTALPTLQQEAESAGYRVSESMSQKRLEMFERELKSFSKFAEMEYESAVKAGADGERIIDKLRDKFDEYIKETEKSTYEVYANATSAEANKFQLNMKEKAIVLLDKYNNSDINNSELKRQFYEAISIGTMEAFANFKEYAIKANVAESVLDPIQEGFVTFNKSMESLNLDREKKIRQEQLNTHDQLKSLIYKTIDLETQSEERRKNALKFEIAMTEKKLALEERRLNKDISHQSKRIERDFSIGNVDNALKNMDDAINKINKYYEESIQSLGGKKVLKISELEIQEKKDALKFVPQITSFIADGLRNSEINAQKWLDDNPTILSGSVQIQPSLDETKKSQKSILNQEELKRQLEKLQNPETLNQQIGAVLQNVAEQYANAKNISLDEAIASVLKNAKSYSDQVEGYINYLYEQSQKGSVKSNEALSKVKSLVRSGMMTDSVFQNQLSDIKIDQPSKKYDQSAIDNFVRKIDQIKDTDKIIVRTSSVIHDTITSFFESLSKGEDTLGILNKLKKLGTPDYLIKEIKLLGEKYQNTLDINTVDFETQVQSTEFNKEDKIKTIHDIATSYISKSIGKLNDARDKYNDLIVKMEKGKSAAQSESLSRFIETMQNLFDNPKAQTAIDNALESLGYKKKEIEDLLKELDEPVRFLDNQSVYEQKLEKAKNIVQDTTASYIKQHSVLQEIIDDQDKIIQTDKNPKHVNKATQNKEEVQLIDTNNTQKVLKEGQTVLTDLYRELVSTGYTSGIDKLTTMLKQYGIEELDYAETITKAEYSLKKKALLDWIQAKAQIEGKIINVQELEAQMDSAINVIAQKSKEKMQRAEALLKPSKSLFDDFKTGFKISLQEITDNTTTFASSFKQTFDQLFTGIGPAFTSNVVDILKGNFDNIGQAWTSLFENMLTTFMNAIMKMQMEKLATSVLDMFTTSYARHHDGGMVGSEPTSVGVSNPALWDSAPRLHSGLLPDEYRAILKKGEGVFTEGQMSAIGQNMSPTVVQQAPKISVVVNNNSNTQASVTQQDVKFNGEEYIVSVWLDSFQRNKYGLRSALGA